MNTPLSLMVQDEHQTQREELFRYADLNHPLMQTLFSLELPSAPDDQGSADDVDSGNAN